MSKKKRHIGLFAIILILFGACLYLSRDRGKEMSDTSSRELDVLDGLIEKRLFFRDSLRHRLDSVMLQLHKNTDYDDAFRYHTNRRMLRKSQMFSAFRYHTNRRMLRKSQMFSFDYASQFSQKLRILSDEIGDGNLKAESRILTSFSLAQACLFVEALDGTVTTVLDGLVVQNGINQAGANGNGNGGGAILTNGATVRNCIFRGNRTQNGKNGAAIHCHLGQVNIENSLFTGNTSSGNGGAIQVGGGTTATIINCTFADNQASGPGGAFGLGTNGSNLNVYNSIAWHNTGKGGFSSYGQNADVNGGGTVISLSSAIESTSTKFTDGNDEGHISLSQQVTPMFVKEAAADGSTDPVEMVAAGYELQEGSPCIDAGNDNYAAIGRHDLAGKNRVLGTHIDMGAFEFDLDATGIEKGEKAKRLEGEKYNLAGQRIAGGQSPRGIVIENRKKILNK